MLKKDKLSIKNIQKYNFKLIECLVTFEIKNQFTKNELYTNIRKAEKKDSKLIQHISSRSFIFDRFNTDSFFEDNASLIKINWVINSFLDKSKNIHIIHHNNDKKKLIGFCVSNLSENNLNIELIAIDKKFRRNG